ncbi:uncharacterized protein V1516DRAFT_674131 [Lipomyces oligophaga]|uniref:uncharacterized protein n=1 Tax=Lipomyces oligophaga TaxID=45792 RepID=UPI0034CE20CA
MIVRGDWTRSNCFKSLAIKSLRYVSTTTGKPGAAKVSSSKTKSRAKIPSDISTHDSLETFLNYSDAIGLAKSSTVYIGTLYEYVVQEALSLNASMALVRCGGKDDKGIDLRGTISLSDYEHSDANPAIPVIVQCKFETTRKPGVRYIRELSGTLDHFRLDTLAILVAPLPLSSSALDTMCAASRPIAYCCVPGAHARGTLHQMIWNRAAGKLLQRLRLVYTTSPTGKISGVKLVPAKED